jgi:hypothetical protein
MIQAALGGVKKILQQFQRFRIFFWFRLKMKRGRKTIQSRVPCPFIKLTLGDQNNSFFHRTLRIQNAKSTITHLWDDLGNRVKDVEQIKKVAVQFYEKLLGSNQMLFTKEKAARIRNLIPTVISGDKAAKLEMEVTAEEIKATFFHMPSNKAPGPDGYTAEFFKASWPIVREEVVAAIKGFFYFW